VSQTVDPLALFPDGAAIGSEGVEVGGVPLTALAERFGTPLYVYDAGTLRARASAAVRAAATARRGGRAAFALKAAAVPGVLRVLREAGMAADCASAGEIAAALRAGFVGADLVVHGNAKTAADLDAAIAADARLVVVDGEDEAGRLAERCRACGRVQDVLLRVAPGVDVDTHAKITTGHHGSKFGLPPERIAALAAALPEGLRLRGLHVHLGSQVIDTEPMLRTAAWLPAFAREHAIPLDIVDVGGGLGVAYRPGDPEPDLGTHIRDQVRAVESACPDGAEPAIIVEPGRSVVARAGVTLYRVVATKVAGDGTRWVAVDGGMGDNLRVGLYGAHYAPVLPARPGAPSTGSYAIAGRHCESTDVIAEEVPLPEPVVGDVLAVPATGAYHQSMAVPYNLFGRPAAVLVDAGEAREITRRESVEDLLAREH